MSSKEAFDRAAEREPSKRRGTRFVPAEDVQPPGLSPRAREVVALALCGFALYAMLCLATFQIVDLDGSIPTGGMRNLGGAVGYHLAHGFTIALGFAGWVPFLMLLVWAVLMFLGRSCSRLTIKVLGIVVFAAMLSILFAGRDGFAGSTAITPYGGGGRFGSVLSPRLDAMFGGTGRLLLVGFGALVSLLIATEWMFSQLLLRLLAAGETLWRRLGHRPAAAAPGVGVADLEELTEPQRRAPRRRAARAPGTAGDPGDDDGGKVVDAAPPRGRRGRRAAGDDPGDDEIAEHGSAGNGAEGGEHPDDVPVLEAGEPAGAEPAGRRRSRREAVGEAVGDAEVEALSEPPPPATAAAVVPAAAVREPVSVAPSTEPVRPPKPLVVVRPAKPKPKPKPKKSSGQSDLPFDDYPFPPIELFQEPKLNDLGSTAEALHKGGEAIVNKLANFNIASEIVAASVGPAVTQFELRLAESIRVNKVVGFESDLAAALKAISVRVVAPIPGKDTIGIEVPNDERQKVYMRDLLDQFGRAEDHAIPLYLGKDVAGNPIVEDMARMPHLLIAGTTGSGKSVCINTILLSILMTRTPQQVKLILVDPKMVELQAYRRVPHLCCDVVTNMKKAPGVLQWAVDEMENRYALLSAAGVNHIKNYNRLGQQELAKRLQREPDAERVQLPYIVIVIDEFADLMNVAANEVEDLIQRLAQKSRAVGMHVILATQRPSSDVITGIIKANLPCQIAFKVNRRIDSRVILDANGAEKLLGFGDMLYMPPSGGALMRAQGTFVSDDELHAVVQFLEDQGQQPDFNPDLVQTQGSSRPRIADRDDRYSEAVEVVLGQQRGSATLLQRALAVGYTRATRLLELMEEDGLVGPFVGSKSRDVLLTLEEWRAREEAAAAMAADAAEDQDLDEVDDGEDLDDGEPSAAGPADTDRIDSDRIDAEQVDAEQGALADEGEDDDVDDDGDELEGGDGGLAVPPDVLDDGEIGDPDEDEEDS